MKAALVVLLGLVLGAFLNLAAAEMPASTRVVVPALRADAVGMQRDSTEISRKGTSRAPVCGVAHHALRTSDPSVAESCLIGDKWSVDDVGTDGQFNWSCTNRDNGMSTACFAYMDSPPPTPVGGQCGSAANIVASTFPAGPTACAQGALNPVDTIGADGSLNWTCTGSAGGSSAHCSAPKSAPGSCGTANDSQASTFPTGWAACTVGSQTALDADGADGTYNWLCNGVAGGSNTNCSAGRSPQPGMCGSAHQAPSTSFPTASAACSAGTLAAVDSSGIDEYYNWNCEGSYGGENAVCTSRRTIPRDGSVYWNLVAGTLKIMDGSTVVDTYHGYYTGVPGSQPPFPQVGSKAAGTVAAPNDGYPLLISLWSDSDYTHYPFVMQGTQSLAGGTQTIIGQCGPFVLANGRRCHIQIWRPDGSLLEATSDPLNGGWRYYIPATTWSGFVPGQAYRINMSPAD